MNKHEPLGLWGDSVTDSLQALTAIGTNDILLVSAYGFVFLAHHFPWERVRVAHSKGERVRRRYRPFPSTTTGRLTWPAKIERSGRRGCVCALPADDPLRRRTAAGRADRLCSPLLP